MWRESSGGGAATIVSLFYLLLRIKPQHDEVSPSPAGNALYDSTPTSFRKTVVSIRFRSFRRKEVACLVSGARAVGAGMTAMVACFLRSLRPTKGEFLIEI